MEEPTLVHLDLRAPLVYEEAPELVPFVCPFPTDDAARELLFCFELDPEQAERIDPAADHFLGELVSAGRSGDGKLRLSAGLYLFVQQRTTLNRDECIHLAIEQQKDGMWEQLCLTNRLYIRCLVEDGGAVTQIFRPYAND
ncbi:MAG: hypothetical protein LBG95_01090 [Treponema sp.]|jgi:hypothetical protein|nr:hypothetical protein [Treponema sp.]